MTSPEIKDFSPFKKGYYLVKNMKMHNRELTFKARELRRNMTKEEKHLWFDFLKDYPVKVLAQKVIGDYIVDFYCTRAKLAIELDGEQHYKETNHNLDLFRTAELSKFGIDVIRFDNINIQNNFQGVCNEIDNEIQCRLH